MTDVFRINPEKAKKLHDRLLEGDPVAPSEIAEIIIEPLVLSLQKKAGALGDDHLVREAAIDALLTYLQKPETYIPRKSNLLTYLTMSAYGDLLNKLSKEKRRRQHEVLVETVEEDEKNWNKEWEETEARILDEQNELEACDRTRILGAVLSLFPDETDRRLLDLMLRGERKTALYSEVLGIQELELEAQRRIVKRHKDRLTKRLRRLGPRIGKVGIDE